jgi:hypothetical protein
VVTVAGVTSVTRVLVVVLVTGVGVRAVLDGGVVGAG